MIRRAALALVLGLGLPGLASAAGWDLGQLMQAMAKNKTSRATFVETKYIALLTVPVTSSGELRFTAPDRLERRTLKPRPESLVLEGDTLTLTRGERSLVLKLQDQPAVAALTESVRATLAGDRAALERHWRVKLEGEARRWTMTLVPTESRTLAWVTEIRIDGEGGELRTVEVEQSDKDRSVMAITKAAAP